MAETCAYLARWKPAYSFGMNQTLRPIPSLPPSPKSFAVVLCCASLIACGGGSDSETTDNPAPTSSTSSNGGTDSSSAPQTTGGSQTTTAAQTGAATQPTTTATPAPANAPAPAPAPTTASAPTPAPAAAPAASAGGSCAGVSQSDALAAINAARAQARQCGATSFSAAPAVAWSGALATAASRHSSDMATRNFFSHTGSDGSSVGQRVSAAGYGWSGVGENIAAGPSSVSSVMAGWLASAGHCANIMQAAYQNVAVACVSQPGSTYTRYWTMVLARP